jgi:hypothetical protein
VTDESVNKSKTLLERIVERLRRSYHQLDFGRMHWVSGFPEEDPLERMYRIEHRSMWESIYAHRPDPTDFTRR